MAIGHLLEDYSAFETDSPLKLTDVSREEQRLAAFEAGYKAGWDDAAKAQEEDTLRISSDLAQNLHELSFTYHEAYAAILKSIAPLMQKMTETVLPRAAHETIGLRVSEVMSELVEDMGQQPVEIVTAPSNLLAIEQIVPRELPFEVSVTSEVSLGEGQVCIRVGGAEREVDVSTVLAEIERIVSSFFEENQKDIA